MNTSALCKIFRLAARASATDHAVDIGERIVAYFDHLGGLEGMVIALVAGGFAFQFKVSDHKREKLAAQIMWLLNRDEFPTNSAVSTSASAPADAKPHAL